MAKIIVSAGYAESLVNFRGRLLQEMARAGHTVLACAPERNSNLASELLSMGVKYCPIRLHRTSVNPLRDMVSVCDLVRLFRGYRPDVALSYTVKPVIYGSLAAKLAGVRRHCSMVTGLGYAFSDDNLKSRLVGTAVRFLYRKALSFNHVIFFQNPDDRDLFFDLRLVDRHNRPILINGSGVDLDYFSEARIPTGPSFLLIARLLKEKGIIEYVNAAKRLKKQYPCIPFRVIGWLDANPAGISPDAIEEWVRDGSIEFLGQAKDVRPHLAKASTYVLPSYREGTPRTVLEAMAMGRPIITTDAPGCRETVVHGVNGFLVPVRDPVALAQAMERFIVDPSLAARMGAESRRIAVEKYDVHKVNSTILEAMGLA